MIQINLLPDVKLEFLKAQRNKRFIISLAIIVSLASVGLVVLLALHVYVNQAFHTKRLQGDIDRLTGQYKEIEDLGTVLTVRQQLLELPDLHGAKPAVTRLPEILARVTPNNIKLSEISVDFTNSTIRFGGQGNNTRTVNTFADILKNVQYFYGDGTGGNLAFSVVRFEIGVATQAGLSFSGTMTFDNELFVRANQSIQVVVPSIISTQSANRPSALFEVPVEEVEQP